MSATRDAIVAVVMASVLAGFGLLLRFALKNAETPPDEDSRFSSSILRSLLKIRNKPPGERTLGWLFLAMMVLAGLLALTSALEGDLTFAATGVGVIALGVVIFLARRWWLNR